MNKKLVSAAVLLGLSGAATAVNVNPDGLGSVLLYPYYTVNGGKFTNIQVVNTTGQTKAVKVRLNEGVNTWEVLDFNLYLSPWDVWTAVIYNKDGSPVIKTTDTSCTVPKLSEQKLRPTLINKFASSHKDPGSLTADKRLTEGHLEMFEMGVVDNAALEKAIKHNSSGVPADCGKVTSSWSSAGGTLWTQLNPNTDILTPAGGLFGSAEIVDVSNGSSQGYNATAVENFYNRPAHAYPGSSFPNVAGQVQSGAGIVFAAATQSNVINGPNAVVTTTWNTPIDAMSAVLMSQAVYNNYYVADSLAAATDWVVSFPTKHAYVNSDTSNLGGSFSNSGQYGLLAPGSTGETSGVAPFAGGFAVPVDITLYDREEQTTVPELDFSPSTVDTSSISYEVNVLEFSDKRKVFDSYLSNSVSSKYDAGWAVLNFSGSSLVAPTALNGGATHTYYGRPVLGFASTEVQNTNATEVNGVSTLANYASLYAHKYQRNISVSN